MSQPNILWISNHDSSACNYGCYGDQYAHTLNVDRLATEGVRYVNAFTVGPICSPSRTSIYTGMHPTTLGTHHHRSATIRPAEVDLLLGDSNPIREELGWSPKVSFDKLVHKMVEFDLDG